MKSCDLNDKLIPSATYCRGSDSLFSHPVHTFVDGVECCLAADVGHVHIWHASRLHLLQTLKFPP